MLPTVPKLARRSIKPYRFKLSRVFSNQLFLLAIAAFTTINILFLQSGVLAAPPAPPPAPGGGAGPCLGFLCGPHAYLLAAGSPFAGEADLINILFYGINTVIVLVAGFAGARAWMAERHGEEWKPIVQNIAIGAVVLFGTNTLVNWVVGA